MEETAMLAAIQGEPQNMALRLVYADWLEERGDQRAEYIRLEEAARAVSPWEEGAWSTRLRRREIQHTCAPAWLETLGYAAIYRPLFSVLPASREHRWRLMHTFVETWHNQTLTPGSGDSPAEIAAAEARLGVQLPPAVREFYAQAGKASSLWYHGDPTFSLENLTLEGDPLLLRFRCDFGLYWHLAVNDAEDPSVVWEYWPYADGCSAFSEFSLVALARQSVLSSEFGGSQTIQWDVLAPHVGPSAPLRRSQFASSSPAALTLLEGEDVLLLHEADDFLFVGARTPAALERLPKDLLERLERW